MALLVLWIVWYLCLIDCVCCVGIVVSWLFCCFWVVGWFVVSDLFVRGGCCGFGGWLVGWFSGWLVVGLNAGVCVGLAIVGFDIRFPGKLRLLWGDIAWFGFWWLDC